MKTIRFSENFNWLAVLKDLAAGAPLSESVHDDLKELAGRWPTCACGQLCAELPRSYPGGYPVDMRLQQEGAMFYIRICAGRWDRAIASFQRIEARTAALLEAQPNSLAQPADTKKP